MLSDLRKLGLIGLGCVLIFVIGTAVQLFGRAGSPTLALERRIIETTAVVLRRQEAALSIARLRYQCHPQDREALFALLIQGCRLRVLCRGVGAISMVCPSEAELRALALLARDRAVTKLERELARNAAIQLGLLRSASPDRPMAAPLVIAAPEAALAPNLASLPRPLDSTGISPSLVSVGVPVMGRLASAAASRGVLTTP